jgi:hypothetical protein
MEDYAWLIAVEPLLVLGLLIGFAWWQFRELNQLKREREEKERRERGEE